MAHQTNQTWLEDPASREAVEGQRRDRRWNWKRPINFWGIVLDEDDQPVPGATVTFGWTDLSSRGSSEAVEVTDASGGVALLGKKGYVMTVRASKPGYYRPKDSFVGLNYAEPWDLEYHVPDPERPVVLRLRKMGETEPLVHVEWANRWSIPEESGEIWINLLKQSAVQAGDPEADFGVRVSHGPAEDLGGRRRFDWDVELIAAGGGWVASNEEFLHLAPESGYESSLRFSQRKGDAAWKRGLEKQFYLRSRDGRHYSALRISVSPFPADVPPSVTILNFNLNPNGSRNLEYDPEKDVTEKYKYGPE